MSRPLVVVLAAVAIAATAAASAFATLYVTKDASTTVAEKPCGDRIFGHIKSLTHRGEYFEMRFDPAWFTSGVTANTAAAEDGAVEPGDPVPNDNYVLEEGHRLLTYLVPPDTPVTVLTRGGDPVTVRQAPVAVSELERIVNGGKHRPLFEPLESGVWLRVHVDTACSVDQQYRP